MRTPDPICLYTMVAVRLRLYTQEPGYKMHQTGRLLTRRGAVGPSSLLLLPGVVLLLADRGPAS